MKTQLLETLSAFAHKRPNRDFNDYGDRKIFNQYTRKITRDLHHARELIRKAELSGITAEHIIRASKSAFSGRLTITPTESGFDLDYCTGQYFPTEYRKAVAAVLAAAFWDYYRADTPIAVDHAGSWIRDTCRREFSRSVFKGYFK
jgi:hypothetical protein